MAYPSTQTSSMVRIVDARSPELAQCPDTLTGTIEFFNYCRHEHDGGKTVFILVRDNQGTTYDVSIAFQPCQADEATALINRHLLMPDQVRVQLQGKSVTTACYAMFFAMQAKMLDDAFSMMCSLPGR